MNMEKLEQRVNKLEDDRFDKLCTNVAELHLTVCGNGKAGLVEEVGKLKTKIKILMTVMMIITSALVGSYVGTNETGINKPNDIIRVNTNNVPIKVVDLSNILTNLFTIDD